MRILITGGTGFLGKHSVKLFCERGYRVRVLAREAIIPAEIATHSPDIEWVVGELSDKAILLKACQNCQSILHLAWSSVPQTAAQNPQNDVVNNLIGTLNLLEAGVAARVELFLFISSGGTVYGVPQQNPIHESHPMQPITPYGISKATIEHYLAFFNKKYGLDYRILRVSNAYGKYQNMDKPQGVIGHWLRAVVRQEPIQIWGDGHVVRDYVYVQDVAQALWQAATTPTVAQKTFNIGSGHGLSLHELAATVEKVTGLPLQLAFREARPDDVPQNVLAIDLAKQALNWTPKTPLELGLLQTWNWLKTIK